MPSMAELQTELSQLKRRLTGMPRNQERTRIENRIATVQAQVDKRIELAGGKKWPHS